MSFSFQGPQLGLRFTWAGRPLPEADINTCVPIQLVTYRYTDASFTGVLKNFRTSAKNSGHGVNYRSTFKASGLSVQCPDL